MFNVMIIDDEPKVRNGLKTIIDWGKYGYSVCGECSDGIEGLEKADELKPDLILVDIRMPEMDGLEFIKRLKNRGCRSKFIILTGYSDFEYTKRAIQLGVNSYLLKPIEENELIETIREIFNIITQENEMMNYVDNGRKYLRDCIIKSIIRGDVGREEPDDYSNFIKCASSDCYQVALVDKAAGCMIDSLYTVIEESVSHLANRTDAGSYVFEIDGRICIVFSESDPDRNERTLQHIHRAVKGRTQTDIFVAMGRRAEGIKGIRTSYQDALEIIENKFYYENTGIVLWRESGNNTAFGVECLSKRDDGVGDIPLFIEKLHVAAEIGDCEKIEALTSELFSELKARKYCEMKFKGLCFNVLNEVYRKAVERYPSLKDELPLGESIMTGIYNTMNVFQLKSFFVAELVSLAQHLANADSQAVMKKILHYINVNYGMNLTLELLGDLFGYNSCYLGKAFKLYSGEYFNDYLEKVRIENAKLLLLKGYKAGEVARRTGFRNIDYFYYKFKKHVGVSTSEYKKLAAVNCTDKSHYV